MAKKRETRQILMLLENNPYPRDERVRREAISLVGAGFGVIVLSPKAPGQSWREEVNGVWAYRYPAPKQIEGVIGYLWEYGYSLLAMLILSIYIALTRGFDVIHAHNPPDTTVIVGLIYKALGKGYIFDHHDLAPEMYGARFGKISAGPVHKALLFFEWASCKAASRVIATNNSYRRIEAGRDRVPESRIAVVRNGPDLARVTILPKKPDLSAEFENTELRGKTVLLYVGVTGYQDGIDYALRALRHLVFDLGRRDFVLLIVGAGDALDFLKETTRKLGLEDYVRFTGWVSHEEVVRYLNAADICLSPEPSNEYNDRSTMIKLTEYMAIKKPIVAFNLPEHRFTAGDSALYARANDEFEYARAISRLMDDVELREKMGELGRGRVESELAWSYSARNLIQMYEELFEEITQNKRKKRGKT